jgi:hypothetical protein
MRLENYNILYNGHDYRDMGMNNERERRGESIVGSDDKDDTNYNL